MDVCVTRKIGAPENPEYAHGAISETGSLYCNPEAAALFGPSRTCIEDLATVVPYLTLAEKACRNNERAASPIGRHKPAQVPLRERS
jgi:predicted phosphoribosyltransferase